MLARNVNELPERMHGEQCRHYLLLLQRRRTALIYKRIFDVCVSAAGLLVLSPLFFVVAILVGLTSRGGVFFLQERVGQNLRPFFIIKFRTMTAQKRDSELLLTTQNDARITAVGRVLRRLHLDELPQLLNVLKGDMSLVGPRPEVQRYVNQYTDRYLATLLIRPGITCTSSIYFRNESELLKQSENAEEYYLSHILPIKMDYNLRYLKDIGVWSDIRIIFATAASVFGG